MRRRRLVSASLAAAMSVGLSMTLVPAAQARPAPQAAVPAAATDNLLGDIQKIAGVAGSLYSAYGTLISLVGTGAAAQQIQQIQALIQQAETEIIQEVDRVATADLKSKCDTVSIEFEDFLTRSPDVQGDERDDANGCVTKANELLQSETDKASLDADALALNYGAVIAIAEAEFLKLHTDQLITFVNAGNEAYLRKVAPTCGSTPDASLADVRTAVGNNFNGVPVKGHDSCFAYTVTPPVSQTGLIAFPTGPGTGTQPWSVTGRGRAFTQTGGTVTNWLIDWPAQSDFSIAQDQAMAGQAWPIVKAALGNLLPDAKPFAPPVSIATPPPGSASSTPVPVFKVDAAGKLSRGRVTPSVDPQDVRFSGWTPDAAADSPVLKSVTSAVNADGRYQVFALDRAGRLETQWQQKPGDDSTWSPWAQLAGPDNDLFGSLSSVTAARNQNGALQLFANDADGVGYTSTSRLGGDFGPGQTPVPAPPSIDNWGPWQTMDGSTVQLSAVTDTQKQIELWGVNSAGALFQRQQKAQNASDFTSTNWTSFTQKAAAPGSSAVRTVSAALNLSGAVDAFGTTDADKAFRFGSGAWQEQVPGSVHYMSVAKGGGDGGYQYMIASDAAGAITLNDRTGAQGSVWSGPFCRLDVARTCTQHEAPYVAYQSNTGKSGTLSPDGVTHDSGVAMMAGTSPSITRLFSGNTTLTAFSGADGFLYTQQQGQAAVKVPGPIAVATGTSPAIASNRAGIWEIVYARPGRQLATVNSFGQQTTLASTLAPGNTSPSITFVVPHAQGSDPNVGFWIAFVNATDHNLWVVNPTNGSVRVGAGLSVLDGTSPSIAAEGDNTNGADNWKVAFTRPAAGIGAALSTVDRAGTVSNTNQVITTSGGATSPSIAWVPAFGFLTAFRGTGGTVWTTDRGALGTGSNFTIAPGSSPSLAADAAGDWDIAFRDTVNSLRTTNSDGDHIATGILISSSSNPSIVVNAS